MHEPHRSRIYNQMKMMTMTIWMKMITIATKTTMMMMTRTTDDNDSNDDNDDNYDDDDNDDKYDNNDEEMNISHCLISLNELNYLILDVISVIFL